jgi:CubicO group peptidase (beta-lactamase class C family)
MTNVASAHATIAGVQQPIRRESQRDATAPAGAIQSSVRDLTRWMRLHLNNGTLDGVRYVSDSTMREMHSIQTPIPTTPAMRAARMVQDSTVGYGMGWQIMDYRGHPLLWHTGNGDGQIAYLTLLLRDRLGVVVLINTWSAGGFIHGALINRILDEYLGFPERDWAAEELARLPREARARDSVTQVMVAMRSAAPPPFPLAAYTGQFDHPLFGPAFIRPSKGGLVLQMGKGEIADLEYHGGNAFYTAWRDALYRENFGTHLEFEVSGKDVVAFRTRINRDEFRAVRAP